MKLLLGRGLLSRLPPEAQTAQQDRCQVEEWMVDGSGVEIGPKRESIHAFHP